MGIMEKQMETNIMGFKGLRVRATLSIYHTGYMGILSPKAIFYLLVGDFRDKGGGVCRV